MMQSIPSRRKQLKPQQFSENLEPNDLSEHQVLPDESTLSQRSQLMQHIKCEVLEKTNKQTTGKKKCFNSIEAIKETAGNTTNQQLEMETSPSSGPIRTEDKYEENNSRRILQFENVRYTPGEASDSRTYEVDSEEVNKKKDNNLTDGGDLKNISWHEESRFNLSSITKTEEEIVDTNRNESSENFEQNKSEIEVNENYVSPNQLEKEDISNEFAVLYNKIKEYESKCERLTQLVSTLSNKQNVHLHLIGHLWQMIQHVQATFQQNQQPQNNSGVNFPNIQRPSNAAMFANNPTAGLNMQNTMQPIRLWTPENLQNLFSTAGTSSASHNSQIGINGVGVENEALNKVRQDTNIPGGNSELKGSTLQMSNGKHVAMWNALRENSWQVFNRQQEVLRIQTRNQNIANNEQETIINKHLDVPVSSNIYAVKETINLPLHSKSRLLSTSAVPANETNISGSRIDSTKLEKNQCEHCFKVLSCQSALKLHYRTHTGERPYKCDRCSRAFTTRGNLRTHYQNIHRLELPRATSSNGVSSNTKKSSNTGLKNEANISWNAASASMTSSNRTSMMTSFTCHMCNSTYSDREAFDCHMRFHNFINVAGIANNVDDLRERHLATSSNDNGDDTATYKESTPKQDGNGTVVVRTSIKTTPHKKIDEENKQLKKFEENSMKAFKGSNDDVLDLTKTIGENDDFNDISEEDKRSRSNHPGVFTLAATTVKPHVETSLNASYSPSAQTRASVAAFASSETNGFVTSPADSPQLNSDIKNDVIEFPHGVKRSSSEGGILDPIAKKCIPRHWCNTCQKQFSSASSLQIHNRTHTGEKPFICEQCGRAFTTKGNWKVHLATHDKNSGSTRRNRRVSMENSLVSPWLNGASSTITTTSNTLSSSSAPRFNQPASDPHYSGSTSGFAGFNDYPIRPEALSSIYQQYAAAFIRSHGNENVVSFNPIILNQALAAQRFQLQHQQQQQAASPQRQKQLQHTHNQAPFSNEIISQIQRSHSHDASPMERAEGSTSSEGEVEQTNTEDRNSTNHEWLVKVAQD